MPVGGEKRISFNAPPGTYTFYCSFPDTARRERSERLPLARSLLVEKGEGNRSQ